MAGDLSRESVDWHQDQSRELWERAWTVARARYPGAADTLVRRVALALVRSAHDLALAGAMYPEEAPDGR